MNLHFFHAQRTVLSDGELDLISLRSPPADKFLQFGVERVWRIALHGSKREIGQISYRDGESLCVYYYGHIGYHIDEPWRGHRYAYKACLLIRDEILRSGKSSVIITCDPDNWASRKTCILLNCLLEGTVEVPSDLVKRYEINHHKCRYIWRL